MRTIAMINQKGGVGKTTTVANLAACLAARGLNVAAIDLDPQSHLTIHLGLEPGASSPGAYEMLTEDAKFSAAAVAVQPNLWLVPASIDLAGAEVELVSTVGREQLLADRLAEGPLPYDYVLIDCPPSLGLLTLNALAAADEVLIPLQPHFLALQGLGKLLETVSLVQRRINPRLRVAGVVLCMFDSNTRLAAEITEDVTGFLGAESDNAAPWRGAKLFRTRIRRNVKLAESPSFGQTIFTYAPGSHGASDYEELADEFLALYGQEAPKGNPAEVVESTETAPPTAKETGT
jgi:chromosome partitioning protein